MYMIAQEILMKRPLASIVLALAISAPAAFSQTEPRFGIGAAVTGHLPVGDLAEFTGFGFGGLGGLELGAYPGLAVTARSGYLHFPEHDDNTLSYVPLMGGLKASGVEGAVYMAFEVGAVFTKVRYDGIPLGGRDVDETNLGWNIGIGSMAGALDLRLSFNVWDAAHLSESMTIGLSVGLTAFSW
jgi:hypothetical protein